MLNIIHTNKPDIYVIGDIHGEFKSIKHWIKNHKLNNCDLIFCGDFGLGFTSTQKEEQDLLSTDKICDTNNVDCYVIRGNHDNPDYYNQPTKILSLKHIHLLPDYTIIQSQQYNILCLGGAISTDRTHRINAYESNITKIMLKKHYPYEKAKTKAQCYWWKNEPFVYNQIILDEIIKQNINIDIICSHTAPTCAYPETNQRTLYWAALDENLMNDIQKERSDLNKLYTFLNKNMTIIKKWYYGHFHEHYSIDINGTRFTLLDMGRNGKMSSEPGGCFDMVHI